MRGLLGRAGVPWLVALSLTTLVLGVHASRLGVELDNASLNARDPEALARYADFRAAFGSDEDLLLAIRHPGLLERDGIALIAEVSDTIAGWDGVRRVWSLATAEELVAGELGAEPRKLLERDASPADVGAALDRNPDLTGWLVSSDRRTAGVVVELEDRPGDPAYHGRIIDGLRALATERAPTGATFHLTGVPVQKHDVAMFVDRDQRLLLPLAIVVLGATLAAFFRRPAGVLLPLGVAGATTVWTLGLYAWSGHATNAITSLLPPVLLVVALASSVHLYETWSAGHHGGDTAVDRALLAVRAIAVPAALCAITTAQGFLSLTTSEIPGVRQLGLFAAFGVSVAFLLGMTAVPIVLTWLTPPPPRSADGHGLTLRTLDWTSRLATSRPYLVLVVFTVLTAAAAAGIPRLRSNTDLVGFLRRGAPLRHDTEVVDATLTGTLPLDFLLRARNGGRLDSLDLMRRLATLEDAIRARPHVTTATSVLALLRQVHRAESRRASLALPDDEAHLRNAIDLLEESGHPLVRRFAAADFHALRVAVRLRAIGSAQSAPLVAAITTDAQRLLGPDYELVPTGALWHVVHDSMRLVREQVASFGTAIILVVLAIGLLFRSVTFTILALIPNLMPIVWTGGLMGFCGIELSTGTAMIASAVLGLVVDDTIHYLSHYRRVYAGDAVAAIRATSRAVGAPVTVTSVSLILGFWVGALGSFKPTIYFSLLTGLTMITGVVCDLLVLPASLVVFERLGGRRA